MEAPKKAPKISDCPPFFLPLATIPNDSIDLHDANFQIAINSVAPFSPATIISVSGPR